VNETVKVKDNLDDLVNERQNSGNAIQKGTLSVIQHKLAPKCAEGAKYVIPLDCPNICVLKFAATAGRNAEHRTGAQHCVNHWVSKSEVILNLGLIRPLWTPPSFPTSGKCQFLVHVIHTIHHVLSTFLAQKLVLSTR
jgi:hypothetical protein